MLMLAAAVALGSWTVSQARSLALGKAKARSAGAVYYLLFLSNDFFSLSAPALRASAFLNAKLRARLITVQLPKAR